jgi:hypothetical protein
MFPATLISHPRLGPASGRDTGTGGVLLQRAMHVKDQQMDRSHLGRGGAREHEN